MGLLDLNVVTGLIFDIFNLVLRKVFLSKLVNVPVPCVWYGFIPMSERYYSTSSTSLSYYLATCSDRCSSGREPMKWRTDLTD